jgi:hypothetical protein
VDAEVANIDKMQPAEALAYLLSSKKLTPEGGKAYLAEKKKLEDIRAEGFSIIEEGGNPYRLLSSKGQPPPPPAPSQNLPNDLLTHLRGGMSNQPVPFTPSGLTQTKTPKVKTRAEAIKILKDNNYPETERNINSLMGK